MIAPCYLIHGGEPQQTEEIISDITHLGTKSGYNKKVVFEINTFFDWEELLNKCQNLDLFAEGTIFELRLMSDTVNKQGNQALEMVLQKSDPSYCILIRAPKLKAQTLNSTWAKYIQKHGKIHVAKSIPQSLWPGWIRQRLINSGFKPTLDTIELVAKCYEGNLLAATQFIQKLKMVLPAGNLEVTHIKPYIDTNTQFSIFELTDNIIKGDVQRTIAIFNTLRKENADPILILWSLNNHIRILLKLHLVTQNGADFAQNALNLGVWRTNIQAMQNSVNNISARRLECLLSVGKTIDLICKGIEPGNAWELLLSICLELSGSRTLTMEELDI